MDSLQNKPTLVVGFDIGGSTFRAAAYDEVTLRQTQKPLPLATFRVLLNNKTNSNELVGLIKKSIEGFEKTTKRMVSHMCLGIAAWVLQPKGIIVTSPHLSIENVELKPLLKRLYPQTKISIHNDLSAIAVAEHLHGGGMGYKNIAVVYFGTGIGCGLILNETLYEGMGLAGEVGHLEFQTKQKKDKRCACGAMNCLEAFAGGKSLLKMCSELYPNEDITLMTGLFIDQKLEEGAPKLKKCIDIASDAGAQAIHHLTKTIHPEVIVLGGGFFQNCQAFKRRLLENINSLQKSSRHAPPSIVVSTFDDDAGVLGAANLSIR